MNDLATSGGAKERSVEPTKTDNHWDEEPVFTRRFWIAYAGLWAAGISGSFAYQSYKTGKEETFSSLLRANRLSGNIAYASNKSVNILSPTTLPDSIEPLHSFDLGLKPTAIAWLNDNELIVSAAKGAFHKKNDLGAIFRLNIATGKKEMLHDLNGELGQEIFSSVYKTFSDSAAWYSSRSEDVFLLTDPKFGVDENGNIFWSIRNECFCILSEGRPANYEKIELYETSSETPSRDGLFKLMSTDSLALQVLEGFSESSIETSIKITDTNESVDGIILTESSSCNPAWNQK